MDALTLLFGEGRDLSSLQMRARAAATFLAVLVFIRISGRRSLSSEAMRGLFRALAWACVRSHALEVLVGGVERRLYRDGNFDRQQMLAALVSKTDILETVRKELGTEALDKVQGAILERNGEISIIRKSTAG